MLSEERIKQMTRIAIIEQNNTRKLHPFLHYRRKDYISICMILHLIIGTVVFMAVCAGVAAYLVYSLVINVDFDLFSTAGIEVLVAYVIYILAYMLIIFRRSRKRYDEGVAVAKQLRKRYKTLESISQ